MVCLVHSIEDYLRYECDTIDNNYDTSCHGVSTYGVFARSRRRRAAAVGSGWGADSVVIFPLKCHVTWLCPSNIRYDSVACLSVEHS